MAMWNPWRGGKRCSEGCAHCYIHKGDAKRGVDTSLIVRTKDFDKPVVQMKKGGYRMKPGLVYLGFSTDFLIEEADPWRSACWQMIRERQDCTFPFLTKRIERFPQCMPEDWADGYENVVVCCTIENQRNADKKLPIFSALPIRHKCITAQPLLERVEQSRSFVCFVAADVAFARSTQNPRQSLLRLPGVAYICGYRVRTVPAMLPVKLPFRTAGRPPTKTVSMPAENWAGSE